MDQRTEEPNPSLPRASYKQGNIRLVGSRGCRSPGCCRGFANATNLLFLYTLSCCHPNIDGWSFLLHSRTPAGRRSSAARTRAPWEKVSCQKHSSVRMMGMGMRPMRPKLTSGPPAPRARDPCLQRKDAMWECGRQDLHMYMRHMRVYAIVALERNRPRFPAWLTRLLRFSRRCTRCDLAKQCLHSKGCVLRAQLPVVAFTL